MAVPEEMRTSVTLSRKLCVLLAGLAALLAGPIAVQAAQVTKGDELLAPFRFGDDGSGNQSNLPFLLEADETRYEENGETVAADGSVVISRKGRILKADQVRYRIADKIVSAKGNVTLVEASGEVLFADEIELTDDLDQGFAVNPRILLPDGSRIAAAGTSRISKDRVEVQRGVFSPCELCAKDPDRAPLWQLRAEKIAHSETRKEIELFDATLDIFGVPVAYTPYFSHPDPRVKKKTGFLTPAIGQDDLLGFTAEVPFFWNIAPNQDLLLTPHIYTESYPILVGTYRHLFSFGQTELEASAGYVERVVNGVSSGNDLRGHVKWTGNAGIDEHWRTNFQYYRSGDDTYLRTYNLDDAGVLRSFASLDGFYRHLFINATAFTAQEQRTNFDEDDTPTALPFITAEYAAPLGFAGINLEGQFAAQALFRPDGGDSQHAMMSIGLNRQWNLNGHLFSAEAMARGDVFQSTETTGGNDRVGLRLFPRATADWSYPVFRNIGEDTVITLAPRVMGTISAASLNTFDLPNEDSQSLEFDATALFRPAFADGIDRFDDGLRIDYGLEAAIETGDVRITGLLGQSFLDNTSRQFGAGTGLENSLSDAVLGVQIEAGDWLDTYQRLRVDVTDGTLSAIETGANLRIDRLNAAVRYSYLEERRFDTEVLPEVNQVETSLNLRLTDHWSVGGKHRYDFNLDKTLRTEVGISYLDECLSLELIGRRDETVTAESGPNDSIIFRIALRHLGAASGRQTLAEE